MFRLQSPSAPPVSPRPPVDYFDRRVKLRLFIGLAAMMLAAAVIERVWDRVTWQGLGQLDRTPNAEPFDSRLNDPQWRTASDHAGTFVTQTDTKSVAASSETAGQLDPVERAWTKGWQEVLARLARDEKSLLFELLHAAADHQPLPPDTQTTALELLTKIDRFWTDYQAAAFQSVADLQGDDQSRWVEVNTRFSDSQPALHSVIAGSDATAAAGLALANLQATLVALARAEIQDDTVVFRPAEQDIWFHELARVRSRQAAGTPAAPQVAYLQLSKQPAEYRGQFVTVKGAVRLAYRVPASQNYLGIKEYFVYWIHPAGGPDSPLLVYALTAPPGFPAVTDRNGSAAQSARKLREDVEVTGIFFKRAAYAAQSGAYTAPLLIAGEPKWLRPAASDAPARPPFSPLEFAIAAAVALVLAICLATVLWKRSRRSAADRQSPGFVDLGPLILAPSPEDRLRELERQARSEEHG
jgi:hypothetical protein